METTGSIWCSIKSRSGRTGSGFNNRERNKHWWSFGMSSTLIFNRLLFSSKPRNCNLGISWGSITKPSLGSLVSVLSDEYSYVCICVHFYWEYADRELADSFRELWFANWIPLAGKMMCEPAIWWKPWVFIHFLLIAAYSTICKLVNFLVKLLGCGLCWYTWNTGCLYRALHSTSVLFRWA